MKQFGGSALFLDRSDINTDEIIPAKYLNEIKKEDLKPYLLEDLELEGFDPNGKILKDANIIITRENFGCGSSREHAPWALEVNDITVVIAESFARIFRQNMFNCGMMAIELSKEKIDKLFTFKNEDDLKINVLFEEKKLVVVVDNKTVWETSFDVGKFNEELVKKGGWIEYADEKY